MRDHQPKIIHRKDYRPPDWLIPTVDLRFDLHEGETFVTATLQLQRNPAGSPREKHLRLDGVGLELLELSVNGMALEKDEYRLQPQCLWLRNAPDRFELRTRVRIHPERNKALEGLYRSGSMFCTQCEAEGFRHITYFLDRPDILSSYRTTVSADAARYPVLLSNGNDVARGEGGDGRHWVTWENPFPMPCYLFALVAGDLARIDDRFVTCSGRAVSLRIFTEHENIGRCDHAMDSLKRAMRWDEEVYGREYDLDIFMIVAVNDFNMGAMENKGLNIFNASCVLASPETATDAAFERIESIVAHEYFHNWSGNRVTCRDWFQLSLKEGFTVFRDQCFSADMGSAAVKRIADVSYLRTAQFAEDRGPLAHPVRPDSYMEISNFYTLTVYEKGAEVVRMLHAMLGAEDFRRGTDLYFERHDGQAVTCDDFVRALEDVSGRDLRQFRRWYSQSGTPVVHVELSHDAVGATCTLTLRQELPDSPGQPADEKQPQVIPVAVALLDARGAERGHAVLELTKRTQSWRFPGWPEPPVPSLLRGFSAPVRLEFDYTRAQLALLMAHDSDGFSRWEAGQRLALQALQRAIDDDEAGFLAGLDYWLDGAGATLAQALGDQPDDPAMLARLLSVPSAAALADAQEVIRPERIVAARERMLDAFAQRHAGLLESCLAGYAPSAPYRFTPEQTGRRALHNTCLDLLCRLGDERHAARALAQFRQADNMTDRLAALQTLVHSHWEQPAGAALAQFQDQWRHDPLVMDLWRSVQASSPRPGTLQRVRELLAEPGFDRLNPNRLRSLVGVFCNQNPRHFHAADGSGYGFLAEQVLQLDAENPQVAARLLGALASWERHEDPLRGQMQEQLERIAATPGLSRDVFDIVTRTLGRQEADG